MFNKFNLNKFNKLFNKSLLLGFNKCHCRY